MPLPRATAAQRGWSQPWPAATVRDVRLSGGRKNLKAGGGSVPGFEKRAGRIENPRSFKMLRKANKSLAVFVSSLRFGSQNGQLHVSQRDQQMSRKQPKRKPRPGVDEYGRTPLHLAACEGKAEDVARLLNDGADANVQDDEGLAPLHFAARAASIEVTKLLLDAGANVRLRDADGNTPLGKAVFSSRGDGSVIKLLRDAGADPSEPNNYGVSPVGLARTIANFDVAQFFSDVP